MGDQNPGGEGGERGEGGCTSTKVPNVIICIDNILVDLDNATNVTLYDSEAVVVWHPFDVCRSLVALVQLKLATTASQRV